MASLDHLALGRRLKRDRRPRRRDKGRRPGPQGFVTEATDVAGPPSLARRLAAEALGTAILLATVVGSGIMAERLAGGNVAIALLGNTIPTGAILAVLILIFAPISGAHFNPVVSLVFALRRELNWADLALYAPAQIIGAVIGVVAAHIMFEMPVWQVSDTIRTGPGQWLAEGRRDLRSPPRDPRMYRQRAESDRSRRRALHHRGLLVHRLDVLRQSRGDHRALAFGQLRRHSAGWRSCLHRSPNRRRARRRRRGGMAVQAELTFILRPSADSRRDRPVAGRPSRAELGDLGAASRRSPCRGG